MSRWSVFTHDDLPPLLGEPVPPPLAKPLPGAEVSRRPGERIGDYDSRCLERQAKVSARAIRFAATRVGGERRQMLVDRALLIEVTGPVSEVVELLQEVEALGVRIERRAA